MVEGVAGAKDLRLGQAWSVRGAASMTGGGCWGSSARAPRALQPTVGIYTSFCVYWEAFETLCAKERCYLVLR